MVRCHPEGRLSQHGQYRRSKLSLHPDCQLRRCEYGVHPDTREQVVGGDVDVFELVDQVEDLVAEQRLWRLLAEEAGDRARGAANRKQVQRRQDDNAGFEQSGHRLDPRPAVAIETHEVIDAGHFRVAREDCRYIEIPCLGQLPSRVDHIKPA